jgi:hypothetical protein
MPIDLAALDPPELVVLLVAIGGLIPVALYHRDLPKWLVVAYGFLLIGAVSTNAEHLLWAEALNIVEHGIGYLGAAVAVALGGYSHGKRGQDSAATESSPENP